MTLTMHIGEFKARFSDVVEMLKKGITIKVIKGKSGELVGYFGKNIKSENNFKRTIGFLNQEGLDIKHSDLQWTDDELKEMGI